MRRGKVDLIYTLVDGEDANELIEYLEKIRDIKIKNEFVGTALNYASHQGKVLLVDYLLARGANPDYQGRNNWTALHNAAWKGHNDVVRLLLDKDANPGLLTSDGKTALDLARLRKSESIVKILDEAMAPNFHGNKIKSKSVWELIDSGDLIGLDRILSQGIVNVNVRDAIMNTPLLYAIKKDRDKIVDYLLAHGANVNIQDKKGRTALHYAAATGRGGIVGMLLKSGANPMAKNNAGETPLDVAEYWVKEMLMEAMAMDKRPNKQAKASPPSNDVKEGAVPAKKPSSPAAYSKPVFPERSASSADKKQFPPVIHPPPINPIRHGPTVARQQVPNVNDPKQALPEDRYIKTVVLGRGTFGCVWLAQDRKLGRNVAIKELNKEFIGNEKVYARFWDEARMLAALQHPNIVSIYDFIGDKFIVMEAMQGGSLRNRLKTGNGMPLAEAVYIAGSVLSALQTAHEKGIIHRDIKPENTLLASADSFPLVKLCDFGVAHNPSARMQTQYTEGHFFHPGTLVYMSPEQVSGKELDSRSDLYSVGAMFYEMLCGKIYIPAETQVSEISIALAIINQNPPPIGGFMKSYPKDVDRFIARMMNKDRAARYSSSSEALAAIKKLCS